MTLITKESPFDFDKQLPMKKMYFFYDKIGGDSLL